MLKVFTATTYKTTKNYIFLLVIYSSDEIIYFSGGKVRLYFLNFLFIYLFHCTCDSLFLLRRYVYRLAVSVTNWLICLFIYHFLIHSFIYFFIYFLHTLFYLFNHEFI